VLGLVTDTALGLVYGEVLCDVLGLVTDTVLSWEQIVQDVVGAAPGEYLGKSIDTSLDPVGASIVVVLKRYILLIRVVLVYKVHTCEYILKSILSVAVVSFVDILLRTNN
jgi:hypothetical protein